MLFFDRLVYWVQNVQNRVREDRLRSSNLLRTAQFHCESRHLRNLNLETDHLVIGFVLNQLEVLFQMPDILLYEVHLSLKIKFYYRYRYFFWK